MSKPVVIIGGGISGLAAAYELTTRGVSFVLLEASERFGGLIHTDHVDGLMIESGADSMLAQKPAAIELCEALGLGSRLISTTPPRTAYIQARGTLHAIPSPSIFGIPVTDEAIDKYELLSESARARLKASFEIQPSHQAQDESVADFFRRQFGPDTVSLIAEPLLGGIHAGDVEQLSIAAVAPQLVRAEAETGSVLRVFRDRATSTTAGTTAGAFRSLRGGMGELVKALLDRLPDGSTWTASPVTAVAHSSGQWIVSTPANAFAAAAVIVAAPAHAAARFLDSSVPALATLCAEVPYVSTASVAMSWPREQVPHPLAGTGFVVARQHSNLRITACSWVTSKWAGRAPDEIVLLRAFVGGATDRDVVMLPDVELIDLVGRDLADVHGITTPPVSARVHRWIDAGAQHNVGHVERMRAIDRLVADEPGLFVTGSGFRSIGVPNCIAEGRRIAAAASGYVKIQ